MAAEHLAVPDAEGMRLVKQLRAAQQQVDAVTKAHQPPPVGALPLELIEPGRWQVPEALIADGRLDVVVTAQAGEQVLLGQHEDLSVIT